MSLNKEPTIENFFFTEINFKCTVVNWALLFLNGGLLEIAFSVPLTQPEHRKSIEFQQKGKKELKVISHQF